MWCPHRPPRRGLGRYIILLHTHSYTQHMISLLTFCLFFIQVWSWERLHVKRPDFGGPTSYPAPPIAHALHDDDIDDVDGDVAGAIHDGLPWGVGGEYL